MLEDIKLDDLRQMTTSELNLLAEEIRKTIIKTTSINGGHLSSNLGIVELTIALHKVFNSPKDKIIFDVSHQTYAHKLLTGRAKVFNTLRQLNGISGFAKRSESIHDAFEGGHSSTSISAGIGFIEAKKTRPNEIGEVIAVVGDASISNGLCFEALNYLGDHPEDKMIIIINDNNMSVSKNVGFLAKKYNSIRLKKSFNLVRQITPVKIKHSLQYYAYKVDLFTSLGFKYFENIDGHNIDELVKYLTYASNSTKSVILHVKTIKGKGYKPAENDKLGIWHGVGPFDIESGTFNNNQKFLTFGEVLSNELINYVEKNSENKRSIRVICPAMILGTGISSFYAKYPSLTIDVGIAEENAVLIAAALAVENIKPVLFIYGTFLQRAYDELMHDIARTNQHVVICVDHCGIVAGDGDTHQGIYDLAMFNSIPGLTILNPVTENDARLMINYALDELDGPIIIRYPKGYATNSFENCFNNSIKWKNIKSGKNYIITYGPNVIAVYDMIKKNNLDIGLVCANCLNIDYEFLNSLSEGSNVFIYEEVIYQGSLYFNILDYVYQNKLNINLNSISIKSGYITHGSADELKRLYKVSIEDLLNAVKEKNN